MKLLAIDDKRDCCMIEADCVVGQRGCVILIEQDQKTGRAIPGIQENCSRFPNCGFSLREAKDLAQRYFDAMLPKAEDIDEGHPSAKGIRLQ